MKNNNLKFFGLFFVFLFFLNFFSFLISAGDVNVVNYGEVDQESWYATSLNFFGLETSSWKNIIFSLIILAIIFVAVYDILELTSIFQNKWTKLIIAGGIAIAAALMGFIRSLSIWLLSVVAGLGSIAVFIEIIIAILIFIGLSFGSNWIAKWAAKRRGQVEEIKAIKSAGKAKAAIRGLREIQKEFDRP